MQLDYVLDHPGRKFLESESAKVDFFHRKLRLPMTALPRRGDSTSSHSRFFPARCRLPLPKSATVFHS